MTDDDKDLLDQLSAEDRQKFETLPPDIRASGLRTLRNISRRNEAAKVAADIREAIAPGGKVEPQQMWAPCAAMPSDLCRVSPFFPMSKVEMKAREYVKNLVITKSSWGEITYTGQKLSVYEEDVLLAALALIDQGEPKTSYRGPLLPLLKLMGYPKPNRKEYKRVLDAIDLLIGTLIKVTVSRSGGKKSKKIFSTNILAAGGWDDDKEELFIGLNPYFQELYGKSGTTLLDLQLRTEIKTQVAKSLFRFVQSQQKPMKMHFLTLAAALNLDLEQPQFQTRRQIKAAISELKKHEILTTNSGFTGRDLVNLERTPESKTRRRLSAPSQK